MKVFFIKNLRGKGLVGDIKDVPDGYATNFLIAGGYAVRATDDVIAKHTAQTNSKQEKEKLLHDETNVKFSELRNAQITIIVGQKDLKGHLYKSIRPEEIIAAIRTQKNIFLEPSLFKQYNQIKETGKYRINLSYKDISTEFDVIVS